MFAGSRPLWVILAFLSWLLPAGAAPPLWEEDFGISLGLSDDDELTGILDDFSFPFAGVVYTGNDLISITSNGFISLGGSNGTDCCIASGANLVGDTFARIAPLWTDLDPSLAVHDVYAKQVFGPGFVQRLIVTWDTLLFGGTDPVRVQLQLHTNGVIVFSYDALPSTLLNAPAVIGVSPGGSAFLPAALDFSLRPARNLAATTFESYASFEVLDLIGQSVVLVPNPPGGFHILDHLPPPAWDTAYGVVVPVTSTTPFEATFSFLNNFSFRLDGSTFSGASLLSIAQHGFVSIGGSNGSGAVGTPAALLSGLFGRVAALWTPLLNAPGGGVYLNVRDDNGSLSGDRVIVTWDSRDASTLAWVFAQAILFTDGRVVISHALAPTSLAGAPMVALSPGGGTPDPGPVDLSVTPQPPSPSSVYQVFPSGTFDLGNASRVFHPNAPSGYRITSSCQPPLWEESVESLIVAGDDATFEVGLPFALPFLGQTISNLFVSTNGFVSLNGDNGADYVPLPADLVGNPFPRVCPLWMDLVSSVFLTSFDDHSDPEVDRVVITWSGVTFWTGQPVQAQAQFLSDGLVVLGATCMNQSGLLDPILTGFSAGNGTFNPGSIDLSSALPMDAGGQATVFEHFVSFPTGSDLLGENIVLTPNPFAGGYILARGRANDDAAGALVMDQGSQVLGSLSLATPDGFSSCQAGTADVWYRVPVFTTGTMTVTTCGSHDLPGTGVGTDTAVAAYAGLFGPELGCSDNLAPPNPCFVGSLSDAWLQFPVQLGDEIWLRVSAGAGTRPGDFLLTVVVDPGSGSPFRRGDCNTDNQVNIADAVYSLSNLFPGQGSPPGTPCHDACDGNDDGAFDIADAIAILGELFSQASGAPPLPAPGSSTCGLDPTSDGLDCASYGIGSCVP